MRLLPIPYNKMQCPRPAPPRPLGSKKSVGVHKAEAKKKDVASNEANFEFEHLKTQLGPHEHVQRMIDCSKVEKDKKTGTLAISL